MKLLISQLHEGPNPFHFLSGKDAWVNTLVTELETDGYRLKSPLEVNLELTKVEPDYFMRGKMAFEVEQACARCAESFKFSVKHPFDVALAHVENSKVKSADISAQSDELDINFFEGNEIDLDPILKEQFVLSLPYQTVCNRDCKGICQHCGKNLNVAPCECGSMNPLSPFTTLKDLKI